MLPSLFGTETSAGEDDHERVVPLQLRKRAAFPTMVRELVVGKDSAGNEVRPHADSYACGARARSTLSVASLAASSGVLPRSRATT
jgi:hypothetical protein